MASSREHLCCFRNLHNACTAAGIFAAVIGGFGFGVALMFYSMVPKSGSIYVLVILEGVLHLLVLISGGVLLIGTYMSYRGRHCVLSFTVLMALYLITEFTSFLLIAINWKKYPLWLKLSIPPYLAGKNILLILGEMAAISLCKHLYVGSENVPLPSIKNNIPITS